VTPGPLSRAWVTLAIVVSVGFAIAAHVAVVEDVGPALGALLSLIPLAVLALWLARRTRRRAPVLLALAVLATALWLGWGPLERGFPNLLFIEHAGAMLVLAIVFGRTLAGRGESLCTRFARMLHSTLPAEVERYTRKVTGAWTIFFAALFLLSCALYLGGFLAAWSLLANILTPILIAAMFVVEYAVRLRVLPGWERVGVLGGIRAFSRHFG
jgi:uncharacterized membrane protein